MTTSKELGAEIHSREAARGALAQRAEELRASRAEASLGDAKQREQARRALAAALADLEDADVALEILRGKLEAATKAERLAQMRAHVARVRKEAARCEKIVAQMNKIAAEYRELEREAAALDAVIRESWNATRELGEPKIQSPLAALDAKLGQRFQTAEDQAVISKRVRELRDAAA